MTIAAATVTASETATVSVSVSATTGASASGTVSVTASATVVITCAVATPRSAIVGGKCSLVETGTARRSATAAVLPLRLLR